MGLGAGCEGVGLAVGLLVDCFGAGFDFGFGFGFGCAWTIGFPRGGGESESSGKIFFGSCSGADLTAGVDFVSDLLGCVSAELSVVSVVSFASFGGLTTFFTFGSSCVA